MHLGKQTTCQRACWDSVHYAEVNKTTNPEEVITDEPGIASFRTYDHSFDASVHTQIQKWGRADLEGRAILGENNMKETRHASTYFVKYDDINPMG